MVPAVLFIATEFACFGSRAQNAGGTTTNELCRPWLYIAKGGRYVNAASLRLATPEGLCSTGLSGSSKNRGRHGREVAPASQRPRLQAQV